jgi:hypothetical protein
MKALAAALFAVFLLSACGEDRRTPVEHREQLPLQQGLNATRPGEPPVGNQTGTGQQQ